MAKVKGRSASPYSSDGRVRNTTAGSVCPCGRLSPPMVSLSIRPTLASPELLWSNGSSTSQTWKYTGTLATGGSIVAGGYNGKGQCNVPEPNADFVTVAGGSVHSLGLKADGSVAAWGCGWPGFFDFGQCNVPAPNMGFAAVAAGDFHNLGLKTDGSIVAWGAGQQGGLVGGLYGVSIGGAFFGESMFHRVSDASKVAFAHLVERMVDRGLVLLDVQFLTAHLTTLGAVEIPRSDYERRLAGAIRLARSFVDPPEPSRGDASRRGDE